VERGNVYKFFNGLPMDFGSVEEEAKFHYDLGRGEQLVNPETRHRGYDFDSAVELLRQGEADMIIPEIVHLHNPNDDRTWGCFRFEDREVGERCRSAFLDGFEVSARQVTSLSFGRA
jgi:hypothetical protein